MCVVFIANRIFLLFETIVFGLFIGGVGLGQVSDIILLITNHNPSHHMVVHYVTGL